MTGMNEARIKRVLEHYETQSEEETVAEDEAAYENKYKFLWEFQTHQGC